MASRWVGASVRGLSLRPGILLVVVLGLTMSLTAACGQGAFGLPAALTSGRETAPEFAFTTFDGQPVTLRELAGKAVVLNFWASWCLPCRAEMPYFETTYRAYQDRGVFIGLAVQDNPESSKKFLKELGITYPNGPDENADIAVAYQMTGLPTTVFITRDGKLARKWTGPLTKDQLVAFVEEIAS